MVDIVEIKNPEEIAYFKNCVCAFGVFDGVHRGHRFLIDSSCQCAKNRLLDSAVLTFDIDPNELFSFQSVRKIMSNKVRLETLASCGANKVLVLPFTRDFACRSPKNFLEYLFGFCAPADLFVGVDLHFGAQAAGTAQDLYEWGQSHAMDVHSIELLSYEGEPITSTRIRAMLLNCAIESANILLGYNYRIESEVVAGRGQGGSFGFKTANLKLDATHSLLGNGVYAGYVYVDNQRYKAAINMGVAATFADTATATCEPHILDFDGNLYGKTIVVEFVSYLRENKVFSSTDELISAVKDNIEWVRANL